MITELEQYKHELSLYIEQGYRRINYLCNNRCKLRYSETDYLSIVPRQIIHVLYKDEEVISIIHSDSTYIPYWTQTKQHEWINNNFVLMRPLFIREF